MFGFLRKKKKEQAPTLREDYKTYNFSGGVWGYHFQFVDKPTNAGIPNPSKVWGHYTPTPRNGDLLKMQMQSGNTMLWIIFNCEYPGDPSDMFYASIYALGYEGEVTVPSSTYVQGPWV